MWRLHLTALSKIARAVLVLAVVHVAGMLGAPASVADTVNKLAVTHYQQNESNWCGPTALQVVVKKLTGTYKTQCNYYRDERGLASTAPCPNNTATTTQVRTGLGANVSHSGVWRGDALTWADVKDNIKAAHPMIAYLRLPIDDRAEHVDGYHFMTLYGYEVDGDTHYIYYSNFPVVTGTGTSARKDKVKMSVYRAKDRNHGFIVENTLINIHD